MTTVFHKLEDLLSDARLSATMEGFSASFPHERIEIKQVHFKSEGGLVGEEVHPDEYIKRMVKLHHNTWIIGQIDQALAIIRAHRDLIERTDKLRNVLQEAGIEELAHAARCGRAS